jgi:hypothetical protein
MAIRRYEHNGNWIEIIPSAKGLATIYDKDILIYYISQIMEKLKRNEPVSQRVSITSYDLLVVSVVFCFQLPTSVLTGARQTGQEGTRRAAR